MRVEGGGGGGGRPNRMPFVLFSFLFVTLMPQDMNITHFKPRAPHLFFFFLSEIIPPVFVAVVPFISSTEGTWRIPTSYYSNPSSLLQKLGAVYLFFLRETHLSILELGRGVPFVPPVPSDPSSPSLPLCILHPPHLNVTGTQKLHQWGRFFSLSWNWKGSKWIL